jgi:hypothetical protein
MPNSELQQTIAPDSSVSSATDTTQTSQIQLELDLATLPSKWHSLPEPIQRSLWQSVPQVPPILNSLYWMWNHTKTRDDQDPIQPYKPFPDRDYFVVLHNVYRQEPVTFVEKSRTMMASWWAAGETVHFCMTHQPSKGIFWSQDEDRSVALLDYAKVLYGQQDTIFRELWPLKRPMDRQNTTTLEFADGGKLIALPGKDPDKIRSEHPSILVVDEACFIDNGGEAFDIAISSKVPKVIVLSSAAPSWFRRLTKDARPIGLERYL